MKIFSLVILAFFAFLLAVWLVKLLRALFRLTDGSDGLLYGTVRFLHTALLLTNIELTLLLVISYLYATPGEANASLALAVLILNAAIALRAAGTRHFLLTLPHLAAAALASFWAFPDLLAKVPWLS